MTGGEEAGGEDDVRLLLLAGTDNVLVVRRAIGEGETITVSGRRVVADRPIPLGHKVARRSIRPAEKVVKYGAPIGSATQAIEIGEHVHVHNMRSDYTRTYVLDASEEEKSR